MVRLKNAANELQPSVQYIHVHDSDIRSLDVALYPPRQCVDRLPTVCESRRLDGMSTDSASSGHSSENCEACRLEQDSVQPGDHSTASTPVITTTNAAANDQQHKHSCSRRHSDTGTTTSGNDRSASAASTRSPSDSPDSSSLILPEQCDDTGVLLYRQDSKHNVATKSAKECYEAAESFGNRSRHNSRNADPLARVRHASYEGPASPKICCTHDDLMELGNFPKVVEGDDSSESSGSGGGGDKEGLCSTLLSVAALAVLLFANLLNYMDRYTIAGKLGAWWG